MPANFSAPVLSPIGEAGKNKDTGFMWCFSELPLQKSMGENVKNLDLYKEGEFFKNRSF
jgi:hypothetical protein